MAQVAPLLLAPPSVSVGLEELLEHAATVRTPPAAIEEKRWRQTRDDGCFMGTFMVEALPIPRGGEERGANQERMHDVLLVSAVS